MAQITLLILGASIGGQFGALGSIVGAFIGLAIASPKSQPDSMSGSINDTEITPNSSWLTDGVPGASSMSSCEPEWPEVQMDILDSLPDATVEPISFSEPTYINPASGLPMIDDGIGGVDVGGNIFGASSEDHF